MAADIFPTEFAKRALVEVGMLLSTNPYSLTDEDEVAVCAAQITLLREYQQMSVMSDFDKSLNVYRGIEISDEQKNALKFIHDITADWVIGQTVEKLVSISLSAKDYYKVAEVIINAVKGDALGDDAGKKNLAQLIVNCTVKK